MTVIFHPDFPKDIKKFEAQYHAVAGSLALRFRADVDKAIERIMHSPGSAGHFINTGSKIVREVRRTNLTSFPFFVLYGVSGATLVFRSLIASGSDPLTWLNEPFHR